MNRITLLFEKKKGNILSLYFTAGYPEKNSTGNIIKAIEKSDADMMEIGIPFSDPVADGKTIQNSSSIAIKNGMNMELLFGQLEEVKGIISKPVLLMGYFNPVMQYGVERFCEHCNRCGIDGVIIPDLPLVEYQKYRDVISGNNLSFIMLVTPGTTEERLNIIAGESNGFVYAVSSYSTTGSMVKAAINKEYIRKVEKICKLPVLTGFGIHDNKSFKEICSISAGGIIGSAFIRELADSDNIEKTVIDFADQIRGK